VHLARGAQDHVGQVVVDLDAEVVSFFEGKEVLEVEGLDALVVLAAYFCCDLRPLLAVGDCLRELRTTWKPPLRQTSW